jgi:DNA uptake protein ComE-like DNA-binding protein
MKPFQFFYRFTKGQQKGVMALFLFIIIFQAAYFVFSSFDFTAFAKTKEEKEWLALQPTIDALKAKHQKHHDTIYPFNPNYISDYKGYMLGLSVAEIDRISAYRKTGKYINSAEDFKKVSGVHDTVLDKLLPFFKFSDAAGYVKNNNTPYQKNVGENQMSEPAENYPILDINLALEEDLIKVYGIGPAYAKAILRRRAAFGAFVSMEQIDDFTEFSAEAKSGLKKKFKIVSQTDIQKINVNTTSLLQLSRFPYFNRDIARSIITERSMNGKLLKINDLLKISGFPVDKEKIIALYLEF